MEKLHPDENQPRKIRSEEYLSALADNIKKVGIINPIEATPDGMIITGESRWRAAKLAKLREVPVRILDTDNLEDITLRQMSENLHRNEMNPIDVAKQLVKTKADNGWSVAKTAEHFSMPSSMAQQLINMLALPEPLLNAVGKGKINFPTANAIATVKDEDQIKWMVDECTKKRISTTRTAQLIARFLSGGGNFKKAKELVLKVPTEAQAYKLLEANGVAAQVKKNLKPGNHLIDIATELMLALRAVKTDDIAPIQIGRLCVTLEALDGEVKKFYKKAQPALKG